MKAFRLTHALRPSGRTDLEYVVKLGVLTFVYVLFARLGLRIHAINVFATLVWPPTGIALAAILLAGYRFWPAIALGAILANLWTGAPFLVALGIGAGNTLEALAGAHAVRRIPGFRSSLDRLIDVLGLIALAGILAPIISATIGTASLLWGGIVSPDRFVLTWRAWWLGDAIGALIVAPVLLTWTPARVRRSSPLRFAEACALGVLLVGTSAFLFEWTADGMASLLSPLLIWAAIRFEQRGAARATLLVSAIAVWATARGHGPFARQTIEEGLFSLQAFMALTAGTFLVLGVITAERRRSQEDTETANRAKDQFLATLSHELRTPLTPVLALSSLLEKNLTLPEAVRRQLEIVRRNAELEARLIDDLLDLTRITRGRLDVKLEPVDLDQAVEHVIEICRTEAASKGLALEVENAVPHRIVWADPARLQQVLWNVVKNAIQFTPRGGRIVLRTVEPSPRRVAVDVADTGRGIEPSQIPRIFQPFQQIGRHAGGLGLGLAISQALVEAQEGTLTVSSGGSGKGTTFRIELTELSGIELPASGATATQRASPGKLRVLLVEDHADTLTATSQLLEEFACECHPAGSIEEALAAVETQTFDLLLSDLGLPDGSGLDLMRSLRDRYGLAGIAVTGYGMEEDVQRSREAGFVSHLVKPITFEKLARAIERFREDRSAFKPPENS